MRAGPVWTAILGVILIVLTAGPLCFHMEPPPEKLQSPDFEDTLDTTSPIILSTSPAHGQVVYPNVDILIQFNESMNMSSFSYEFVSGWDPGMNWIWESTVYENDTIRGTHGDLFSSPTLYQFNVTYAEDLSGNALAPGPLPNPWNWITIVVIISTDPAHGETKVDTYRDIIVNFSGPVDPTSNITWTILPDPGGWTEAWLVGDTVFMLSHLNPFEPCIWYAVGIYRDGSPFPSLVPNPWWFETWCPPRVIRTDPEDGQTDVPLDYDIRVWFSDPMATSTVLFVIDPGLPVTVSWSDNDTLLTISHNVPFLECQIYTVQIVAGQDMDGLDIVPGPGSAPNPWSFMTVCINPTVLSTFPPNGGANIPLNAPIIVNFSEPMNTTTVTWTIAPDPGGWLADVWTNGDQTLTLVHTSAFAPLTDYTVTVTDGEDLDGNPLVGGPVPNPWMFTTGVGAVGPYIVSTYPPDRAVDVPLDAPIIVNFSEPIDILAPFSWTIAADEGLGWTEVWTNGDQTLTLTHSIPFTEDMTYTVEITEAQDIDGDPLKAGLVPNPWSFTTRAMSLAPPTNVSAFLSGPSLRDVTVTWQISADDFPGGNVSYYDVYRGDVYDAGGAGYGLLGSVPSGVSQYVDQLAGQDANCYYYFVCSAQFSGEPSCSENQAGKFTRPLANGPNLVSIPLIQSDQSTETVLQTVRFDKAWFYDSFSREWKWYNTFKGYRRGLWNVNHTMGLWINVTGPSDLTVAGVVPAQTEIQLFKGWNLVSFPSFNANYTVANLKMETGATRVEGMETMPPFPPSRLRELGDAEVLLAGEGYWVRVDSALDWIIQVS